jgi:hypothetical protein
MVQNYHPPTVQTDIGEGPNTRDGKDASNSDHKTRKTSPLHQPNKRLHKTQPTLALERKRIGCHVCFAENKIKRMQFKCAERNVAL